MPEAIEILRAQAPAAIVVRRIAPQPSSTNYAAADLRAATRYYEQHVIAWYALGRVSQARAARDAIARHQENRY